MKVGDLRHRVTIQQNTPVSNAYGEPVESWATYATRWAAVEPLSGRELFMAQQFQARVTTRIRLRYWTGHGVTPQMRVSWDGRLFEIDNVVEVRSARRELHLLCSEVQG